MASVSTPGTVRQQVESYESSPCSTIDSNYKLTHFGDDLNVDLEVAEILEFKAGRDVDFEEAKGLIRSYCRLHGNTPNIRQLANELAARPPPTPSSGSQSDDERPATSPAWCREFAGHPDEHGDGGTTRQPPTTPAFRPVIPGLNLVGVKKQSPGLAASHTSPVVDDGRDVTARLPAGPAQPQPTTPDSASPTYIFKIVLPTACKSRAVPGPGHQRRGGEQHTPTVTQLAGPIRDADVVVGARLVGAEPAGLHAGPGPRACFRVSMDDLDQQPDGPRRAPQTLLASHQAAGGWVSPAAGFARQSAEKRNPSVARNRRHQDQGLNCLGVTAKRQLRLEPDGGKSRDVDSGDDLAAFPADSSLRPAPPREPPSDSASASLVCTSVESLCSAHAEAPPGATDLEIDEYDKLDVQIDFFGRGPQRRTPVPALSLSARNTPGGGCTPQPRGGGRGAEVCRSAVRPSARVPPLALGMTMTARTGVRTRRTSVLVKGRLTRRTMAAGAASGVTSHALTTVFWAESDDDPDDYSSYGTDTEEELFHGSPGGCAPVGDVGLGGAGMRMYGHSPSGAHAPGAGPSKRPRGRRGRQRNTSGGGKGDDSDGRDDDLMLPEELWNALDRLSGPSRRRQYNLLESLTEVVRISRTCFSTVFRASHDGQPVVVKIYDVDEREMLAHAFAEIGVLIHLTGWSGAVSLLDYGRREDQVLLMLESCDHSLKDWCDKHRYGEGVDGAAFTLQCLKLWSKLSELLSELHERFHVAHCDLKPGNVLLLGDRLLLADFSESMMFKEAPLLQNQARGTVQYQPPEVLHRRWMDARKADVWAMGCILYEMVTGELLFKGNSDAMRAVTSGGRAAAQQLQQQQLGEYARNRLGNNGGGDGATRQLDSKPTSQAGHQASTVGQLQGSQLAGMATSEGPAAAADYLGGDRATAGEDLGPSACSGAIHHASHDQSSSTAPMRPPRVPKLPLGLARPPAASPASAWRGQSLGGHGPLPSSHSSLPPHLALSARSGRALTGRSLELIAEGSGNEDATSLASDLWASALNTARTTARSHLRADTARSVASASTAAAAWPPPPPPSAGTARSVAESEWTLAVTVNCEAPRYPAAEHDAEGSMYDATPGPEEEAAEDCAVATGFPCDRGQHPGGFTPGSGLPPHLRLRHSVGTQCADPAGPDWMMTEEADRLRIMVQEPPSFVAPPSPSGRDEAAAGYRPRKLSGADGPSLGDDVLGLLRAILVEAHQRPTMQQVSAMAKQVLQRHTPPPQPLIAAPELGGSLASGVLDMLSQQDVCMLLGSGMGGRPQEGVCAAGESPDLHTAAPDCQGPAALPSSPCGGASGGSMVLDARLPLHELAATARPTWPRLSLMALQETLPVLSNQEEPLTSIGRCNTGTDGGSWTDGSSLGGAPDTAGGDGDGDNSEGGAMPAAGPGPRALSLFDVCQPLVTARGQRPYSRSWQRLVKRT